MFLFKPIHINVFKTGVNVLKHEGSTRNIRHDATNSTYLSSWLISSVVSLLSFWRRMIAKQPFLWDNFVLRQHTHPSTHPPPNRALIRAYWRRLYYGRYNVFCFFTRAAALIHSAAESVSALHLQKVVDDTGINTHIHITYMYTQARNGSRLVTASFAPPIRRQLS